MKFSLCTVALIAVFTSVDARRTFLRSDQELDNDWNLDFSKLDFSWLQQLGQFGRPTPTSPPEPKRENLSDHEKKRYDCCYKKCPGDNCVIDHRGGKSCCMHPRYGWDNMVSMHFLLF